MSPHPEPDDARARAAADERLRQFLQWREETGRAPQPWRMTGKQVFYTGLVGIAVGTVLASVLMTSLARRPGPDSAPPATTAVARSGPVETTTEPSPSREPTQHVAVVERAPDLPPRPAKRPATERPVDRRPARVPPSSPVWDWAKPPPAVEPSPLSIEAPVPVAPAVDPLSSAPSDRRDDAPPPVPPPATDRQGAATPPVAPPLAPPHPVVPSTPSASAAAPPEPAPAPPAPVTAPPSPVQPPAAASTMPPPPPIDRLSVSRHGVVVSPPPAPVTRPLLAPAPSGDRIETLKWLAGYIPEVWLARKVAHWVRSKPPAGGAPQPEPAVIQAR